MELMQVFANIADHSQAKGFGINSLFFISTLHLAETNIVNISILVALIIYYGKQFLLPTLYQSRQQKVLVAIQEAEDKLQKASIRLNESEKQLAQTQLVIEQCKIKQEAEKTALKVKQLIIEQGKNAEQQIRRQIQQQISTLAIKRVTLDLKNKVNDKIQSQIIDDNIAKLGGSL
uniref:ATP synthase CF0 subunit B n=1 Tax=Corynoplastis japonica TaxID=700918 RepID=A0A1X9PTT1_9RHOD|nr:ATP synthase CF0 subunit B [Corynoplastis japonica]